jgi:hypothetical protein
MLRGKGHAGPIFVRMRSNGFSQCGWHSPAGRFYPCPTFLHRTVAGTLSESFYPGVVGDPIDLLLGKGWVRASCDGYYEVARLEGSARTTVLDLVATLPPEAQVAVDLTPEGDESPARMIEGFTAGQFYDRFI